MFDQHGQQLAHLVLLHALGEFFATAHDLELIPRARIPLELDVEHFRLALVVRLDRVPTHELAGGFEALLVLAAAQGGQGDRSADQELFELHSHRNTETEVNTLRAAFFRSFDVR